MNKKKNNRGCSDSDDCKPEVDNARKFVKRLSRDDRGTYTVAHFDLKGSTKLMRADAIEAIGKMLLHNKICRSIAEKNKGKVIKELGDAVMVRFKTTGKACECSIKIIRNLKNHEKKIKTKVTISHGTLWNIKTTNEDDIYGEPVNRCARMSKYAKENCILIEESAYEAVKLYLKDQKNIRYQKITCPEKNPKIECDGNDIVLDDFGVTPMRKIVIT